MPTAEPLLLLDAVDMVEDAGFTAYGVAIRLLEWHDDIRIPFTDVDMPGSMDGLRLAHAVRDRWPPITIILASGHVRVTPEELPENGMFFAKPYAPAKLTSTLHTIAERLTH